MMALKSTVKWWWIAMPLVVSACTAVGPETAQRTSANEATQGQGDSPFQQVQEQQAATQQDLPIAPDPFLRMRILADMLYEARLAFDDNRLTLPAGDNAYDRYLEVLGIEPDNPVALQGIADIAQRYVVMANEAIRVGQFDTASSYLQRAEELTPDNPAISESRRTLDTESSLSREYFTLDTAELDAQSIDIMSHLGTLGEYVRNNDATFLITARTDAEGRWIYRIMREAVGGYRLRGNIALGARPAIQINIPQS